MGRGTCAGRKCYWDGGSAGPVRSFYTAVRSFYTEGVVVDICVVGPGGRCERRGRRPGFDRPGSPSGVLMAAFVVALGAWAVHKVQAGGDRARRLLPSDQL
jgi:hypothetical protein